MSKPSLAEANPELAKEWHPTKNGELTPGNVTPGSGKKVWWKCDKAYDHEWEASVGSRSNGNNCPCCSGCKIVKSNCLATLKPKLARQWHLTKNGELTPFQVSEYSNKKVWWECKNEHEWNASVSNISMKWDKSSNNGCPKCYKYEVPYDKSFEKLFPEIAKEWHPLKNGNFYASKIPPTSTLKIWWRCTNQHEWQATVVVRSQYNKCKICKSLGFAYPALAKEWHPTKNGKLTPSDVDSGSGRKVWWQCDKGDDHEWKTDVNSRAKGSNCPICFGQKVVASNSLKVLNSEIAGQWHPTKNGNLTPEMFRSGSDEKVWWKCSNNIDHDWKTTMYVVK